MNGVRARSLTVPKIFYKQKPRQQYAGAAPGRQKTKLCRRYSICLPRKEAATSQAFTAAGSMGASGFCDRRMTAPMASLWAMTGMQMRQAQAPEGSSPESSCTGASADCSCKMRAPQYGSDDILRDRMTRQIPFAKADGGDDHILVADDRRE